MSESDFSLYTISSRFTVKWQTGVILATFNIIMVTIFESVIGSVLSGLCGVEFHVIRRFVIFIIFKLGQDNKLLS